MSVCIDCGGPKSAISPGSLRCSTCANVKHKLRSASADKRRKLGRPTLTQRLAAALLQIRRGKDWLVPEPLRSEGSAEQIVAWVEWDHYPIPVWLGGDNRPQNLQPLTKAEHMVKSSSYDTPNAAKAKRIEEKKAGKTSKRPMLGSRASGWRKRMDGRVERR